MTLYDLIPGSPSANVNLPSGSANSPLACASRREREALATTAKTVLAMAAAPGAACQQIRHVFEHERRPLRARNTILVGSLRAS
ncbi:hypothetical protein ACIBL8_38590 [Streptomyces sp. NPDC050523]|uniref:hypothetical protein n=1 Tax=Streptomyces sp. NPDC050523 TaxID=3365622 RepID=UPI0037AF53C6